MTEMAYGLAGLLVLGILLGGLAAAAGVRRRAVSLFVFDDAQSLLAAKAPELSRLLRAGITARGFSALGEKHPVPILSGDAVAVETAVLQRSRQLGADYALVVSLHDLTCEVDEFRMTNLATLRVNTTLCVAFRMIEVGSGRVLAEQTLAHCRKTAPIVSGTSVGSDVVDRLLGEVAERISGHLRSLPLAA
jgi:hypothetical protein